MTVINDSICPRVEKCPIFINNVFHSEIMGKTYKSLYCMAGKERYTSCKRHLAAEKFGKPVPAGILPNSFLSLDEIGKQM